MLILSNSFCCKPSVVFLSEKHLSELVIQHAEEWSLWDFCFSFIENTLF